jgi:hypothetical protein
MAIGCAEPGFGQVPQQRVDGWRVRAHRAVHGVAVPDHPAAVHRAAGQRLVLDLPCHLLSRAVACGLRGQNGTGEPGMGDQSRDQTTAQRSRDSLPCLARTPPRSRQTSREPAGQQPGSAKSP